MADEIRDAYVETLEMVRDQLWPGLATEFEHLKARDASFPEHVEGDWLRVQRSIFDAIALAVLEVRGIAVVPDAAPSPLAGLPRPIPREHADHFARERYWRSAHAYFHVVWTRDTGREGYVKRDWRDFDERIVATISAAIVTASGGSVSLP